MEALNLHDVNYETPLDIIKDEQISQDINPANDENVCSAL
jgi:hypothetical protein